MLENRLKQGEDFGMLAQSYSEDPNFAANGGDIGSVPQSSLDKASHELRKALMDMNPGQISNVIHTQEGYRILKVISKEPAGQRELNDPRVQETIRMTLFNRQDQLLKAALRVCPGRGKGRKLLRSVHIGKQRQKVAVRF